MKAQNYCMGFVLGFINEQKTEESQLKRHKCQNNLKPFSMSLSELYGNNRLSEVLWNVCVCACALYYAIFI